MANYGVFRKSTIKGEKGTNWTVQIFKKNYANIVKNYNFLTNLDDWSFNSDVTHNSTNSKGGANVDTNNGSILSQINSDLIAGQNYFITIKVSNYTSGVITPFLGGQLGSSINSNGEHTQQITAGSSDSQIVLSCNGGSEYTINHIIVSTISNWAEPTDINLSGEGFEVTWNGQGGTRDRVFLGSECKLNLIVENNTDENFVYSTIESGNEEYFIRIYKSSDNTLGVLWWFGWVAPAFDKIENSPYPYVSVITATDSYGFFKKKKPEFFTGETQKNQPHRIRDIIFNFINDMSLLVTSSTDYSPIPKSHNWLRTNLNWYSSPHTFGSGDPAMLYYVAKGFVSKPTIIDENGNIQHDLEPFKFKLSDVLDGILKSFNTIGFLAEGRYNFIQPNNYADNTSGDLTCFEYNSASIENPNNPVTVNTLLTINQSTNVILGGSSLNYEPSFERVTVNHIGGFSNVNVGQGQDMTTEFHAGSLQGGLQGQLNLSFNAKHSETILYSDFNFNVAPGTIASQYEVASGSFKTIATLTVRLNDGTSDRYLKQVAGQNILEWDSSSQTITIERGYSADTSNPVNNEMAVGLVTNSQILNNANFSAGPCQRSYINNNFQKFITQILFDATIEAPPITGDIYITLTCNNDYFQVFTPTGFNPVLEIGNLNDPTPNQKNTTAETITIIPFQNNQENDVTNGITYSASQTQNTSIEQFDLGDVNLGQSTVNNLYSFQYNSGTSSSNFFETAPGFKSNNSDSHINASQLLVNEFLKLQIEPLEILQADIQSQNISPLKLIKYSINNDNSYKYYTFLGGTFKAQSEVLSGEWFKINSVSQNLVIEPTTPIGFTPQITNFIDDLTENISNITKDLITNNSNGNITTGISNTSTNKVIISTGINGSIFSGQKLLLSYPDGSYPTILTASSSASSGDVEINVQSFTPNIIYPIGSIISPLTYEVNSLANTALSNAATAQTKADANASNIAINTTDIADNQNDITASNNDILQLEADMITKAPLASPTFTGTIQIPNITDLESYVSTNRTDIADNQSDISTNGTNISNNATAITTKANSANPVFTGTVQIGSLNDVETSIDDNTNDISANVNSINSVTTKANNNESNIATNVNSISTNASNITAVDNKTITNANTLSNHATFIATNSSAITTNTSNIANKADIDSPTFTGTISIPNIANVETAISNNTTKSTANETDIASNSSSIITNGANILSNTTSISANTTRSTDNQTNISSLTTTVNANTTKSTDNESNIASNTTSINVNSASIISNNNLIDTKNKTFFSSTQPTVSDGIKVGDIWFDSNNNNTIKRFDSIGTNATTESMLEISNDKQDIGSNSNKLMTGAAIAEKISTISSNPGGQNTQIQFNDNGSFNGESDFTYDKTTKSLSVSGRFEGNNIGNIFDTEAYLTAVDFCLSSDRNKSGHTRSNGAGVRLDAVGSLHATFQVPLGYKATHVQVYGSSSSSTFDVYACDVTNNTNTALTNRPSVGTNQVLSSVATGSASKYLSIKFTPGATTRDVYGAKITLSKV